MPGIGGRYTKVVFYRTIRITTDCVSYDLRQNMINDMNILPVGIYCGSQKAKNKIAFLIGGSFCGLKQKFVGEPWGVFACAFIVFGKSGCEFIRHINSFNVK